MCMLTGHCLKVEQDICHQTIKANCIYWFAFTGNGALDDTCIYIFMYIKMITTKNIDNSIFHL